MSIFLAVMFTCGTIGNSDKICTASVFNAIKGTPEQCQVMAQAEANAAELRIIKGGFINTSSKSDCVDFNSPYVSKSNLDRYMHEVLGAKHSEVLYFDFKNGKFNPRRAK